MSVSADDESIPGLPDRPSGPPPLTSLRGMEATPLSCADRKRRRSAMPQYQFPAWGEPTEGGHYCRKIDGREQRKSSSKEKN